MPFRLPLLKHIGRKDINENESKDVKMFHEGGQDSCNQCVQHVITQNSLKPHKEVVHEGVKHLGN